MSLSPSEQRRTLQRRIKECGAEIERLRRGGAPSRDEVERLAKRLGRELRRRYGDEPTYQNKLFPRLRSLTIPGHTGLKRGTALKILNQLEEDLAAWERRLNELGGPSDDDE